MRRNSSLKKRLVCKKKKKTELNVTVDAKWPTRMKQIRTIVEFWPPLVAQTQVTFDVYCYVLLLFIYCKVCFLFQRY
jgi:hypothetical protein